MPRRRSGLAAGPPPWPWPAGSGPAAAERPAPGSARWARLGSDVYDRAGQRPGNARYPLDLRYDEASKVIHVVRLRANDHVVGARYVVGLGDATDLPDGRGHIGG